MTSRFSYYPMLFTGLVFLAVILDDSLCAGEASKRYTVRRAGNVVQADSVADVD